MEPSYLRRLAFIKYLFSNALKQSHQIEPSNSLSLLSFHDSVELFLQLSLEKLGIAKKSENFINYWDIINEKLKNTSKSLTQKESMKRLNKARVNLKHYGNFPSKLDIEIFRATTSAFFNENCPVIFDIDFDTISLIDLISFERTRELLKEAEIKFKKGIIKESKENVALSFEYLLDDYEKSTKYGFYNSELFIGDSIRSMQSDTRYITEDNRIEKEFFDKLLSSLEKIQKSLKILCYGLNYRKYLKFISTVPSVSFLGNEGTPFFHYEKDNSLSKLQFEFCREFIIESALKLQESSFETKQL